GTFVRIPDAGVTDGCGEALVEGNTARNERRAPVVAEYGDAIRIDVIAACQIVRNALDRGFELVAPHDLLELHGGPFAEEINRKQRNAAFTGVRRHLEQKLFLAVTGLA